MAAFTPAQSVGHKFTATDANNLIDNEVVSDSGIITITPAALNTPLSGVVTFNKTFPSVPRVFVTVGTSSPHTRLASITAATTTGVTVWLTQTTGSLAAQAVQWYAVLTQ